jgi:hypothetical protein
MFSKSQSKFGEGHEHSNQNWGVKLKREGANWSYFPNIDKLSSYILKIDQESLNNMSAER